MAQIITSGAPLANSIIAVLITSYSLADALPTNRKHEPAFVKEPTGRGTIGLIVSCVLTLVLCVWTAMHVDVLDRPLPFRRLVNKCTWVMVGLFAPEIVLATAYTEWGLARKLLRVMHMTSASEIAETTAAAAEAAAASTAKLAAGLLCAHRSPRTDTIVAIAAKASKVAMKTAHEAREAAKEAVKQTDAAGEAIGELKEKEARGVSDAASSKALDLARSALAATRAAVGVQERAEKALRRIRESGHETNFSEAEVDCIAQDTSAILGRVKPHWFWKCVGYLTSDFRSPIDLIRGDRFEGFLGMEGAFFGVMGGFMLCPLYPSKQHGFPLRSEDLIYLLERGLLVSSDLGILKEDVADKGKADMVAKLLVCSQAVWMTINCLCRKLTGVPVTLLEIHVVVHVLCAVCVYLFWWRKPQDVGLHLTLGSVDKGRSAFIFAAGFDDLDFSATKTIPDSTSAKDLSDGSDSTPSFCHILADPNNSETISFQVPSRVDDKCHGFSFNVSDGREYSMPMMKIFNEAAEELRKPRFAGYITDSSGDCLQIRGLDKNQIPVHQEARTIWKEAVTECRASLGALYWLGIGYSSFHASAWNYSFPTEIEKWLWRASCITVGGLGLVVFSYTVVKDRLNFRNVQPGFKQFLESHSIKRLDSVWMLLRVLLSIVYVSARVFVVVEAFISIRSLPEGSYKSIPWAQLLPHF